MKHLGAEGGKLEHFVIGYFVELFGVFDNSRVGGINAVHIGINMAGVGLERRGDGNGSRVGAASSEGGYVVIFIYALKTRNNHDVFAVELGLKSFRLDFFNAGVTVV